MAAMRSGWGIFLCLPTFAMAAAEPSPFDAAREVLETRCLECHTKDQAKGELVFETREGMIHGGEGGTALKPGDSKGSPLLARVQLPVDDDDHMPPKKNNAPLEPDEIAALSKWIEAGAPWPDRRRPPARVFANRVCPPAPHDSVRAAILPANPALRTWLHPSAIAAVRAASRYP